MPDKDPKRVAAAKAGWEKRQQAKKSRSQPPAGAAASGAAARPPTAIAVNPAPAGASRPASKAEVDSAISDLIGAASILYVYYLTRYLDAESRNLYRSDETYALSDEECDRLTPIVKRLLDKVPGGQGVRGAVQVAEHLSLILLLIDYADRTAPLRAEVRQQGRGPARRMIGRRRPGAQPQPTRPAAVPAPTPPAPPTQGAVPSEQPPAADSESPFRPAVHPGVAGSQYRAG